MGLKSAKTLFNKPSSQRWDTSGLKTVNYSFPSNFVDFALVAVIWLVKKLEGWLGGKTSFWKS